MDLSRTQVRYLRSLSRPRVRRAERKFVLEGWRALAEAVEARARVEYVAVDPARLTQDDYRPLLQALEQQGVAVYQIRSKYLDLVSDVVHSQGVVALVRQRTMGPDDVLTETASLVVAADGLADPGNLGTVLRTCDWFGSDGLLLGAGSVDVYNEKVVRSSVGSIFHLRAAEDVDLVAAMNRARELGFRCLVAAGDADTDFTAADYGAKTMLVLGSEGHGVSAAVRAAADGVLRIPKYGRVESLNVGVACGILLSHVRRLRTPAGR